MSIVIEKLNNDHKNIAKLLNLLEEQVSHLEAGEFTDFPLIADIMHYFANYPDIHHHPYEDLIFDTLKTKDDSTAESIRKINNEHAQMAQASNRLFDEVNQLQGNAVFSRDELVQEFKNYISRFYEHMRTEENELFPKADRALSEEDWHSINAKINLDDDPLFGDILDQQYKNLYTSILAVAS